MATEVESIEVWVDGLTTTKFFIIFLQKNSIIAVWRGFKYATEFFLRCFLLQYIDDQKIVKRLLFLCIFQFHNHDLIEKVN